MKYGKRIVCLSLILVMVTAGSLFAKELNPTPENPVTLRIGTLDKEDDLSVGLEYTMCKVFEAMAMAKPIIATPVSDLPEILDGCGLLVEPGNTNRLAEGIQYLLEEGDVAEELGEKAREKSVKEYSWDAMGKILSGVFGKYED